MGSLRAVRLVGLSLLSCALTAPFALPARAWQTTIEGQQDQDYEDSVSAMKLTAAGNVVVAGTLDVGLSPHWLTAKLAGGSGAVLWRQEIEPTGYRYSGPHDLDVAVGGDVVAAGEVLGGTGVVRVSNQVTGADLALMKLEPETGAEIWRFTYDGGAQTTDVARAVAIDEEGHVYSAGYASSLASGRGITVLKLDGATGSMPACQNGMDDDGDGAVDFPADAACLGEDVCSTQIEMSGFSKVEMSAFSSDPRYPRGHGDSDHELRGAGSGASHRAGDRAAADAA
jgi:hypothetical protein